MPELCKYGYQSAAASHQGRVRTANEDSFGICADKGFFVVCDGMGGAAAGEVASRIAVDTMLGSVCRPDVQCSTGPDATGDIEDPPAILREAVSKANQLVFSQAACDSRLHGMGTTLVALLVHERRVWVAHVGDSRCYRCRNGVLTKLTRDHSLVDEQVKMGQLTPEEAERSPLRNVITRAVGSQRSVLTELGEFDVLAGDLFLLCSDGLTRELNDARIQNILMQTQDLDVLCRLLIDSANEAGGRDNVTTLVVRAK